MIEAPFREPTDGETGLKIRRGRVDSVDLYEVKDSELDVLEKGTSAELQLNFAIFLISVAFSAICSLSTSTFKYPKVETIFMLVSIVGVLGGTYLIIQWRRTRTSVTEICKRIRDRIPPDVRSPVLAPPCPSDKVDKEDKEEPPVG